MLALADIYLQARAALRSLAALKSGRVCGTKVRGLLQLRTATL